MNSAISLLEQGLSPMMRQYCELKNQHRDELVFYRLGDFYEMFFEDAETASRELELTLTGRDCGLSERAPMCGVPYHSCDGYIARLIQKGYKVAICEQMEDAKEAKGLVRRDVVRVVTPGTILESQMLEEGKNNFIGALAPYGEGFGCALADVSTGEVLVLAFSSLSELLSELTHYAPRELLLPAPQDEALSELLVEQVGAVVSGYPLEAITQDCCTRELSQRFTQEALLPLAGTEFDTQRVALAALLRYLQDTQRKGIETLGHIQVRHSAEFMHLDAFATRNLELTKTLRAGESKGSLLWVLDKTHTAMGKRLLRSWLLRPLLSPVQIVRRQNAVAELFENAVLLGDCADALSGVLDLERLIARVSFGNANPRDLKALEQTAKKLPHLKELLANCQSDCLKEVYAQIDPLEDLAALIQSAIEDNPPGNLREGAVIRGGYHPELDELRELVSGAKGTLAKIEAKERERTGIKTLKVGYNRVFGYYIEMSRLAAASAPEDYIRKQTLAGSERYITEELKDLENRILSAGEKIERLEARLYHDLRERVCKEIRRVQETAGAVGRLDVLGSLAVVSVQNDYTRPQITLTGTLQIKSGRHPVVERLLPKGEQFVSNDVLLDMESRRIALITGPNMAGKSTYMRMTALIVILAQMGCFVPAAAAECSVVDGVYTRVGASDDLATGQSTFMVEMREVAEILKNATKNSLLILDEIGRGTSTFDGMSIARAVIEHIAGKKLLGAKAMFATHYHELTELSELLPCLKNYNVSVLRRGDEVLFLRRIVEGAADDSYGIYVAKLAGIPTSVVRRAEVILKELEASAGVQRPQREETPESGQLILGTQRQSEAERRLQEIKLEEITPLGALNLLYELKGLAESR